MGWGLDAKSRVAEFQPVSIDPASEQAAADIATIDGNAMFRSEAVGASPLASVVKRVLGRVLGRCPHVLVCFDNPGAMPELRGEVAQSRAAKAPAHRELTADEILELRESGRFPHGVTWEQLFCRTETKRLAFRLIYTEVRRQVKAAGDAAGHVTVTDPSGAKEPWVFPAGAPSPFAPVLAAQQYGEAEAQMVVAIRDRLVAAAAGGRPLPSVIVHTIDTDILLQLLGIWAINVRVCLSKAWVTADGVEHRTKAQSVKHNAAARKQGGAKRVKLAAPTLVWKQYSMDVAIARFGPTRERIANAQLWLLMAGGVDYCSGLGGYGWYKKTCLKNADRYQCIVSGDGNTLVLRLPKLVSALATTRNAVRRDADVEAFVEELCRLVYCWRYYNWPTPAADAVAGPAYDTSLFSAAGCRTVAGWLGAHRAAEPLALGTRPDACALADAAADAHASYFGAPSP